jgi:hypothetical protein
MSKIITTHVTLDSPVEDVWEALTTLPAYGEWNPFITSASGMLALGERLDLTIHPPGGRPMRFKPWVTAVEEHRYLEWLGRVGMPGIFDGRHSFTLTPLASGRTLLQQSETFSGALVPFAGSVLDRTRAGFELMNRALGHRVGRSRPNSPEASESVT